MLSLNGAIEDVGLELIAETIDQDKILTVLCAEFATPAPDDLENDIRERRSRAPELRWTTAISDRQAVALKRRRGEIHARLLELLTASLDEHRGDAS